MAEKSGSNASGSPSDEADAIRPDPATQQEPGHDASDQAAPPTAKADPKPQPSAGDGDGNAKPNPVQDALDRVRSGEASTVSEPEAPTPAAEKPADKAEKPAGDKPADPAKAKPEAPKVDPIDDWSQQEKQHTKGKVKERYRALHTQFTAKEAEAADLRKQLDEAKADAEHGRAFKNIGERFKVQEDFDTLEDEQIAFTVRAQAAAVRAVTAVAKGQQPSQGDLAALADLRAGLELVEKHLGIAKPAPAIDTAALNAAIEEAEVSGDFKALRELIGTLPTGEKPAERPQATPARAQQDQPPRAAAPAASSDAWAASTRARLVRLGVPEGEIDAYYTGTLLPEMKARLARENPRRTPNATWATMPDHERTALLLEAHAAVAARRSTPPPAQPPAHPASAPIRTTGRAPVQKTVSTGDRVKDAIDSVRFGRVQSTALT